MKKTICLFLFAFIQNSFCQNIESHDLAVSIEGASYYAEKFSSTDLKLDPGQKNALRLHEISITLLINSSDPNIMIDFNNFSLVENELKLRLRPNNVEYRELSNVPKFNLKKAEGEDVFLKYSQEGIKNLDYYYPVNSTLRNLLEHSISQQERFYLLAFPNKNQKKRNRFTLSFSVDQEDSGEFSLYYKDQLIKTFILKRGERLEFQKKSQPISWEVLSSHSSK